MNATLDRISARQALDAAQVETASFDILQATAQSLHLDVAGRNTGLHVHARTYWVTYEEIVGPVPVFGGEAA